MNMWEHGYKMGVQETLEKNKNTGLSGKWFHTFNANGRVKYQGQIIGVDNGFAIVQYYEWFAGCPTNQAITPLTDVVNWKLYETSEDMNEAYETKYMHLFKQDIEESCMALRDRK